MKLSTKIVIMKKSLLFILIVLSGLILFSCSSDDDDTLEGRYYVKYTLTGGSWYRPPFGHESKPTSTGIKYMDKDGMVSTSQSGKIMFTKVIGPVNSSFKPSLSASGTNYGTYSAYYEATIEILRNGEQLVGSNSTAGYGNIALTCKINE